MNLNGKGWLKKYLAFRCNLSPEEQLIISGKEQSIYKLIQPTGMLYGHPIQLPHAEHEAYHRIRLHNKMKVIALESFIHHGLLQNTDNLKAGNKAELMHYTAGQLVNFYESLYPELAKSGFSFWGKRLAIEDRAELMLTARINIRGGIFRNFWSSFFHNSLLFLDVFYFGEWIGPGGSNPEKIGADKENMRLAILKIIASSAYADGKLEQEERTLFKYFLKSAHLTPLKEEEAMDFLHHPIAIEDLDLPEFNNPWLLKKYLLELAILTVWSDRVVTDSEKYYLRILSKKLGFDDLEMESSMLALEAFVIEHWNQVHYLRNKKDYHMVSELVMNRFQFIINLNKERVVQEIHESKELMQLLAKSRKQSLTPEEKEAVRAQILDIFKLIPAFVIVALPGTFITLPFLLKILPKGVFPSAFQD